MATMAHKFKSKLLSPLLMLITGGMVLATLYSSVATAIAQGYTTTDTGLETGMVVSLSLNSASSTAVERATQESSNRVVGIVTTMDTSAISVSSATSKVLVETNGPVSAYVSDIN